jgi:hypothetical protein
MLRRIILGAPLLALRVGFVMKDGAVYKRP